MKYWKELLGLNSIINPFYQELDIGMLVFYSVTIITTFALKRKLILASSNDNHNGTLSDINHVMKSKVPTQQDDDDVVIKWCDRESFEVLSQLCDALIPSLPDTSCTSEAILSAIIAIHPSLAKESNKTSMIFNVDHLQNHKEYLCRGAIDIRLPKVFAKVIQKLASQDDQWKLYLLLKLLSTSIGTYLLFGWPIAFPDLPLQYRMKALVKLRESPILPLRVIYQTFRRLTGSLFFSYCEKNKQQVVGSVNSNETKDARVEDDETAAVSCALDRPNPSWNAMKYDPIKIRNDDRPRNHVDHHHHPRANRRKDSSKYLRSVINYNYVKSKTEAKHPYGIQDASVSSSSVSVSEVCDDDNHIDVLEADVVVIGSGAGGGMMAYLLAKEGLRVVVLEKGGYYNKDEFQQWSEVQGLEHLYEKGALCNTVDGNVTVLAGSCVGGGTTVNWSASFSTPDWVREDWVGRGLSQFKKGGSFDESLQAVHELIHINSDNSYHEADDDQHMNYHVNDNNRLLWKSASKLGYKPEKIPRNVKNCVNCGHCCYGCPYESKQSTITGLLEPLLLLSDNNDHNDEEHPHQNQQCYQLHVIPYAFVEKVLYEKCTESDNSVAVNTNPYRTKRAIGVEATVKVFPFEASHTVAERLRVIGQQLFTTRRVRVNAKIVVCSAGALHTPAVLLRSKIAHVSRAGTHKGHSLVGAFLTLHPVLGAAGIFPKDVNTGLASGVSMGVVVREPIITASDDTYRIAIQTPPIHLGFMGLIMPWSGQSMTTYGGLSYKISMMGWSNMACFVGISRDKSSVNNRISIDHSGQPVIKYNCMPVDTELMLKGLEKMLRFMRAGGAKLIFVAHENFPFYDCSDYHVDADDEEKEEEEDDEVKVTMEARKCESIEFEKYVESVRKEGVKEARMQVFSAHQMSSCRMAASPDDGPTSPTGELYECKNLYISDASAFPSSLGINPMVTIEALSHMISKDIIKNIERSYPELSTKIQAFRSLNRVLLSQQSSQCGW